MIGRTGGFVGRARAGGLELASGIAAVGVKELRGRMRGRRAFIAVTVYLGLLAGFAAMLYSISEKSYAMGGGTAFISAQLGRTIFIGLLLLETLLVLVLAPAFTTSTISGEREKQTLDMLLTTPISSLAIVLGKLLSALTWTFLLIVASIPLTALVFVFGGAGPEDVIRGYLVLLSTAIGVGAIGLFFSAMVRRTQSATVLTYITLLALTLGTGFVFVFWGVMTQWQQNQPVPGNESPIQTLQRRPPEALLWFNPFVADLDVMCGTDTAYGGECSLIGTITDNPINQVTLMQGGAIPPGVMMKGGVAFSSDGVAIQGPVGIAPFQQPAAPPHDTYWPRATAAWVILSAVLVLLSGRLVTPTRSGRRLRLRLRRSRHPVAAQVADAPSTPAGS
jgi:ABC-type transport system involved in multi-copper enzyme maturation permease subunit